MSYYISDYEIEKIIEEDINPIDLTSELLGMKNYNAKISYSSRSDIIVCCTEEAEKIAQKCGLKNISYKETGTKVEKGEIFFQAEGRADKVHLVWRNIVRLFESFCGISTRAYDFVERARRLNPDVNLVCTRKNIPGTKKLTMKAIMAGGAFPHRLGLSETVLIFDEHIQIYGGKDKLISDLPKIKVNAREKKIGIEAHNYNNAIEFVNAGFDFIQLDKFEADTLEKLIKVAKKINPNVTIVAAGGVNSENVEEYAKTGVDVIATSALYFGKSADIKAHIEKL